MLHISKMHELCHYVVHRQAFPLCTVASVNTPLKHTANMIMLTKRKGGKEASPHSKGVFQRRNKPKIRYENRNVRLFNL